jgi:peroxiredoxin
LFLLNDKNKGLFYPVFFKNKPAVDFIALVIIQNLLANMAVNFFEQDEFDMKRIGFIFLVLISGLTFSQNKGNVGVGDKALNFSLNTVQGQPVELDKMYKSRPVVLVVLRGWPGYQCPICTQQVGGLVADAGKFAELGAAVLMVYPGPSEQLQEHAREFSEDFEFADNFYFVLDPDYTMINLYGLRWDAPNETAFPSTFVIDKKGKIVFSKVSSTHGDRAINGEIFKVLQKLGMN